VQSRINQTNGPPNTEFKRKWLKSSRYPDTHQSLHEAVIAVIEIGLANEWPVLEVGRGELLERALGTATRRLMLGTLLSRMLEVRGVEILVRSMEFEFRGVVVGVVVRSTM
jgi:hypothetical protein